MARCTKDSPCTACAAGLAKLAGRRPERPEFGAGSPAAPRLVRRFGSWDDVLCRASLLPRHTCGGCQVGHHNAEAWT